jgi:alpha-N-arabinofuranosidase
VQDALEELEYVMGDKNTQGGALRARDGHPAPFKLHYVEIGNEDWFDRAGTYSARFDQFYDAIKAKYPQLQIIATTRVTNRQPDVIDEHYYRAAPHDMESHANDYDSRPRTGPKVFVGEWATRLGSPTPNISGALGDAAWMIGMERNSDLVILSCYAPLFVNVSDLTNTNRVGRSMQWPTDLIGYDALNSYGSPGYYAQKMFNLNHGDEVLAVTSANVPMVDWQPPTRRSGNNGGEPTPPPIKRIPTLFFNATRDAKTGIIYVKVVNTTAAPETARIEISGSDIAAKGEAIVMSANAPDDTNSINDREKIVPVTTPVDGLGKNFTREFPPYSITVLRLAGK